MLNGLDPIMIFNFYKKLTPEDVKKFEGLPIAGFINKFSLPPIPLYLSEQLTGLYIESEEKNIEIATTTDSLFSGAPPEFQQKALNTSIKINLVANAESLGLSILSVMADLIFPKVTSAEYSIIYIHKSTIILSGLLHSFSISHNSDNTLAKIAIELINKPISFGVNLSNTEQVTLNNAGGAPAGGAEAVSRGLPTGGKIPQSAVPIAPRS